MGVICSRPDAIAVQLPLQKKTLEGTSYCDSNNTVEVIFSGDVKDGEHGRESQLSFGSLDDANALRSCDDIQLPVGSNFPPQYDDKLSGQGDLTRASAPLGLEATEVPASSAQFESPISSSNSQPRDALQNSVKARHSNTPMTLSLGYSVKDSAPIFSSGGEIESNPAHVLISQHHPPCSYAVDNALLQKNNAFAVDQTMSERSSEDTQTTALTGAQTVSSSTSLEKADSILFPAKGASYSSRDIQEQSVSCVSNKALESVNNSSLSVVFSNQVNELPQSLVMASGRGNNCDLTRFPLSQPSSTDLKYDDQLLSASTGDRRCLSSNVASSTLPQQNVVSGPSIVSAPYGSTNLNRSINQCHLVPSHNHTSYTHAEGRSFSDVDTGAGWDIASGADRGASSSPPLPSRVDDLSASPTHGGSFSPSQTREGTRRSPDCERRAVSTPQLHEGAPLCFRSPSHHSSRGNSSSGEAGGATMLCLSQLRSPVPPTASTMGDEVGRDLRIASAKQSSSDAPIAPIDFISSPSAAAVECNPPSTEGRWPGPVQSDYHVPTEPSVISNAEVKDAYSGLLPKLLPRSIRRSRTFEGGLSRDAEPHWGDGPFLSEDSNAWPSSNDQGDCFTPGAALAAAGDPLSAPGRSSTGSWRLSRNAEGAMNVSPPVPRPATVSGGSFIGGAATTAMGSSWLDEVHSSSVRGRQSSMRSSLDGQLDAVVRATSAKGSNGLPYGSSFSTVGLRQSGSGEGIGALGSFTAGVSQHGKARRLQNNNGQQNNNNIINDNAMWKNSEFPAVRRPVSTDLVFPPHQRHSASSVTLAARCHGGSTASTLLVKGTAAAVGPESGDEEVSTKEIDECTDDTDMVNADAYEMDPANLHRDSTGMVPDNLAAYGHITYELHAKDYRPYSGNQGDSSGSAKFAGEDNSTSPQVHHHMASAYCASPGADAVIHGGNVTPSVAQQWSPNAGGASTKEVEDGNDDWPSTEDDDETTPAKSSRVITEPGRSSRRVGGLSLIVTKSSGNAVMANSEADIHRSDISTDHMPMSVVSPRRRHTVDDLSCDLGGLMQRRSALFTISPGVALLDRAGLNPGASAGGKAPSDSMKPLLSSNPPPMQAVPGGASQPQEVSRTSSGKEREHGGASGTCAPRGSGRNRSSSRSGASSGADAGAVGPCSVVAATSRREDDPPAASTPLVGQAIGTMAIGNNSNSGGGAGGCGGGNSRAGLAHFQAEGFVAPETVKEETGSGSAFMSCTALPQFPAEGVTEGSVSLGASRGSQHSLLAMPQALSGEAAGFRVAELEDGCVDSSAMAMFTDTDSAMAARSLNPNGASLEADRDAAVPQTHGLSSPSVTVGQWHQEPSVLPSPLVGSGSAEGTGAAGSGSSFSKAVSRRLKSPSRRLLPLPSTNRAAPGEAPPAAIPSGASSVPSQSAPQNALRAWSSSSDGSSDKIGMGMLTMPSPLVPPSSQLPPSLQDIMVSGSLTDRQSPMPPPSPTRTLLTTGLRSRPGFIHAAVNGTPSVRKPCDGRGGSEGTSSSLSVAPSSAAAGPSSSSSAAAYSVPAVASVSSDFRGDFHPVLSPGPRGVTVECFGSETSNNPMSGHGISINNEGHGGGGGGNGSNGGSSDIFITSTSFDRLDGSWLSAPTASDGVTTSIPADGLNNNVVNNNGVSGLDVAAAARPEKLFQVVSPLPHGISSAMGNLSIRGARGVGAASSSASAMGASAAGVLPSQLSNIPLSSPLNGHLRGGGKCGIDPASAFRGGASGLAHLIHSGGGGGGSSSSSSAFVPPSPTGGGFGANSAPVQLVTGAMAALPCPSVVGGVPSSWTYSDEAKEERERDVAEWDAAACRQAPCDVASPSTARNGSGGATQLRSEADFSRHNLSNSDNKALSMYAVNNIPVALGSRDRPVSSSSSSSSSASSGRPVALPTLGHSPKATAATSAAAAGVFMGSEDGRSQTSSISILSTLPDAAAQVGGRGVLPSTEQGATTAMTYLSSGSSSRHEDRSDNEITNNYKNSNGDHSNDNSGDCDKKSVESGSGSGARPQSGSLNALLLDEFPPAAFPVPPPSSETKESKDPALGDPFLDLLEETDYLSSHTNDSRRYNNSWSRELESSLSATLPPPAFNRHSCTGKKSLASHPSSIGSPSSSPASRADGSSPSGADSTTWVRPGRLAPADMWISDRSRLQKQPNLSLCPVLEVPEMNPMIGGGDGGAVMRPTPGVGGRGGGEDQSMVAGVAVAVVQVDSNGQSSSLLSPRHLCTSLPAVSKGL